MPMKEEARLTKQPQRLSHDRFSDRRGAALGWRSYKARDYSRPGPPRSLQQLYPTTLLKKVLRAASDICKNQNTPNRWRPRLARTPQKTRQRHRVTTWISQPFLDWSLDQYIVL